MQEFSEKFFSHAIHLASESVRKQNKKADHCIAALKTDLAECPERRRSLHVPLLLGQ